MTEWNSTEKPVLDELTSRGWEYIPGKDLPLEAGEFIITEHLWPFMLEMAKARGMNLREDDMRRAVLTLSGGAGIEGAKNTLHHLKMGFVSLNLKKGIFDVPIIDYENPNNNRFVVSNQVVFLTPQGEEKRPDIVLFVNGIPLVVIECKAVGTFGVSEQDAVKQLMRYERELPGLFRFAQLAVAAAAKVLVYPTEPWSDGKRRITRWRDDEDDLRAMGNMLSPAVLLDLLRNFIFISSNRGEYTRIMPRYMQYHAVNAIYDRVMNGKEKGGIVWHWQGSGKSYSMIFAAYKLYRERRLDKPTIFFVVDRRELAQQLYSFLTGLDLDATVKVESIENIRALEEVLRYDSGRGKRGMFILLIQKFRESGGIDIEEIDGLPITNRDNIIVFVDEAHRSQYGILAARMKRVLKNARFFGFTGTPLLKADKSTVKEFGSIVHRYFIEDSLKDGYTVPLSYTFRREDFHLDKDQLRKVADEIIPEGREDEVRSKIHPLREFLTNENRIRAISRDIAEDYMVNRQYKAMVVATSRKAAVLYRRYILEALRDMGEEWPDNSVETVISYGQNDEEVIVRYRKDLESRYGMDVADANREIIQRFRKIEKEPRIVVVTDMLLTGYDVPVLEVMYLDKIMNGHNLLQAIARTNRPYGDKEYGVVVDYVGIFKRFKAALREYYEIEPEEAERVAYDREQLKGRFLSRLDEIRRIYPIIDEKRDELLRGERTDVFAALRDVLKKEDEFVTRIRELRGLYRALGGDEIKADSAVSAEYRAVSVIYATYLGLKGSSLPPDIHSIVEDLIDAINSLIEMRGVSKGKTISISQEFVKELGKEPRDIAVVDMTVVLEEFVSQVRNDPVERMIYGDIVESIEKSLDRWRRRQATLEEFFEAGIDNIVALQAREDDMKRSGLTPGEYALLNTLRNTIGADKDLRALVADMMANLREKGLLFKGWRLKHDTVKDIRQAVRRDLLLYLVKKGLYEENKEKLNDIVDDVLNTLPGG